MKFLIIIKNSTMKSFITFLPKQQAIFFLFSTLFFVMGISGYSQTLKDEVPDGKYIGTIANINFFENPGANEAQYETLLTSEFNGIVAENNYKMGFVIPNQPSDPFNLTVSDINIAYLDRMIDYANQNGMIKRGHALIWYNQAPGWLSSIATGWTDQQIYDFAEQYITVVLTYTKGKIEEWDVFNEAISDGYPASFRTGTWYDNVASVQDFMDQCFMYARAADPDAVLFYNDYNIEEFKNDINSKNGFMLNMVQGMIDRNVPIDAVGLQSHFISGSVSTAFTTKVEQTMDLIIASDLVCNITELDIRICNGDQTPSQSELNTQKEEYKRLTGMALSKSGSTGLTMWGFTDRYSWIPFVNGPFFDGCDNALIFDKNYNKKPSYDGVFEALQNINGTQDQSPFSGTPIAIPGVIEFENYDLGGAGVAYSDQETTNQGGSDYRSGDGVDIAEDTDGYVLAYTETGEWLEYTINVQETDSYNLTITYTSNSTGSPKARIEIDGETIVPTINFTTNGSWNDYIDQEISEIDLPQGTHVLRFYIEEGAINFDKMTFSQSVLSINDISNSDVKLSVFPMPFDSEFFIEAGFLDEDGIIDIFDIKGRKVISKEYIASQNIKVKMDEIPSGFYVLQLRGKSHTQTLKIVKR